MQRGGRATRITSLFMWFAVALSGLVVSSAYPGGGLDAYGCHNNRKVGGYHCHLGSLTGESFASKEEMLRRLKAKSDAPEPPPA